MLAAVMQEGWDGPRARQGAEGQAAAIAQTLPLGMTLDKVTDQAVNITSAVDEFMMKFAMALGVVLLVSLLSLGWRVGIVVAAAVPLTLAVVFLIMLETGRFFDRITLGALILALGLLVDDAIIAIEVMVVKMEEGMDRIKAAAYAWSHTCGADAVGNTRDDRRLPAGGLRALDGRRIRRQHLLGRGVRPHRLLDRRGGLHALSWRQDAARDQADRGGHHAIYGTPNYRRLRRLITFAVRRKFLISGVVGIAFALSLIGMSALKQQFFPTSDRPEVLVEVRLPEGASIETTTATVEKLEHWLRKQSEAKIVTSYIGQGAPRFFFAMAPELPNPAFAKIVALTPDAEAREALKHRLREAVSQGPRTRGQCARYSACVRTLLTVPGRVSGHGT
jgi:multidrug efflux pump subunit AcrB